MSLQMDDVSQVRVSRLRYPLLWVRLPCLVARWSYCCYSYWLVWMILFGFQCHFGRRLGFRVLGIGVGVIGIGGCLFLTLLCAQCPDVKKRPPLREFVTSCRLH